MRNILVSGYYGFNNAGDELVLQEIIKGLKKLSPESRITVLSKDPEYTRSKYKVLAEDRWSFLQIIKEVSKTDILISGGGSLLQDKTSKNGILYYLGIILLGKIFRKKLILFSQGIGPVVNKRNIFLLKKILSWTDYLSVRDEDSLRFLKEIGIKREIKLSADPVFLIESADQVQKKRIWEMAGLDEKKKLITVSLRPWANIEKVIKETKLFLDDFDRSQYQVRYLSFHQGEDDKIIRGKVPEGEILNISLAPEDFAALIGTSFLTVGMRLHSLILAAAQGVKFISISYDPKVDSLDKKIYNSEVNIRVDNISQDILEAKFKIVNNTDYSNKEMKRRALIPFKYLKDR